jgi:hypothetical protein
VSSKWQTDTEFIKAHINPTQFEIEAHLLDIAHEAGCARHRYKLGQSSNAAPRGVVPSFCLARDDSALAIVTGAAPCQVVA